ncbi:uncharacterized protein I206_104303 [Kwoniella pini CBS 10737]|uniref:Uncharacterized protein n=1 Tax=Kwoniella pini CBS 10737 TaxID=1296096 RepID=A0A1B9I2B2_9TREE|nr:uncharacterized protein I206_04120 [Kwoniella pini CBS 10737]OCF49598.1 hypothetical protein I206_04120 [Kwoniella pini CBS 10737]
MGKLSEFLSSSSSEKNNQPPPPTYNDSHIPSESSSRTSYQAPPPPPIQQTYSSEPPPPFPHLFACLHLGRSDRVRLIGLPQNAIPAVEEAIRRVWIAGIQTSAPYYNGWEWKLSGNPWYGRGAEAVYSRRLLSHILHALSSIGWDLHMSCDLTKKGWDKDTLILHSVQPHQKFYFSISFNESDKIRIIDPPDNMVKDAFVRAVKTWPLGIQTEYEKEPGAHQLKLRGNPWLTSDGTQVVEARLLACTVLSAMESVGFELVGSVDMSTGSGDNNYDLDTWFFASKT